jgi:hypothetical protein
VILQVGNGHNDETIQRLQTELKMTKISQVQTFKNPIFSFFLIFCNQKQNKDYSKVPDWLEIDKSFTPDFVVTDPRQ